ncbi:LysR family transcriptional regulator [Hydromonas duriensis]|nr:LysR family transcriptional regulator [Hydromonas duriensis]
MQKSNEESLNLNLNTLPFLDALLKTSSITRAGELLGLSQPAASRTMSRLRVQLNDPLLVRTRKGYTLTNRARTLETKVRSLMQQAQEIFVIDQFDPALDKRNVRFASTDYGISIVLKPLLPKLYEASPHLSIEVAAWQSNTLHKLEHGELDFAIYTGDLPADFHQRRLFTESYSLVMSESHPLVQKNSMDEMLKNCANYPRVIVSYPAGNHEAQDDVLSRLGCSSPPIKIVLPYFHSVSALLENNQMICVLPTRLAIQAQKEFGLKSYPLEVQAEMFDYYLIWHHRSHFDAMHCWMRQFISEQVE